MRIWLADAPGVLGAVAAEIGEVEGNVIGLEVLEREAGVAIDELMVELPDRPDVVDAVCRGIRNVPGAGVEEVIVVPGEAGEAPDREDTVLAAAAAIVGAATPEAVLKELRTHLRELFGLAWLAVSDDALTHLGDVDGDAPGLAWIAAFAEGARSGTDPANDTTGSGVFIEAVPGSGLTLSGGRTAPIRRRERREITMLALVAGRYIDALSG
jgi:hypothetical protein